MFWRRHSTVLWNSASVIEHRPSGNRSEFNSVRIRTPAHFDYSFGALLRAPFDGPNWYPILCFVNRIRHPIKYGRLVRGIPGARWLLMKRACHLIARFLSASLPSTDLIVVSSITIQSPPACGPSFLADAREQKEK